MNFDFAPSTESENFGKIVFGALVLSILLHAGGLYWAWHYELSEFGERYYEQIVPRKFRVDPVEIDASAFDQGEEDFSEPKIPQAQPIDLPPESISFDTPSPQPKAPRKLDPSTISARESTAPMPSIASSFNDLRGNPSSDMVEKLEDIRRQLLESEAASPARPTLKLPAQALSDEEAMLPRGNGLGNVPGYSGLEELLKNEGPLQIGAGKVAPILLPSDVLFSYDEAELQEEALAELWKLGTLIQRNPSIIFLIEGHTDSFGLPEYNQALSERRAQAVKRWLVEEMGIDAEHIHTQGFGSRKLLVPATESIDGQRLNRRVEIVLKRVQ